MQKNERKEKSMYTAINIVKYDVDKAKWRRISKLSILCNTFRSLRGSSIAIIVFFSDTVCGCGGDQGSEEEENSMH